MVTLTVLLARRRLATRLVIGVRPGEQFGAHAWLVHEHAPLLPAAEAAYEELVTL